MTRENISMLSTQSAELPGARMRKLGLALILCLALALVWTGCCTQQEQRQKPPAPPAAAPKPTGVFGYFPSGRPEGSGLLLEKIAPAEVVSGQPYQYSYKVSNLTDATLENVQVTDRVSSDFVPTDSQPKATSVAGGVAIWNLGTFGPKQVQTIVVNGSSPDEGTVTTCGWATYIPVVCQEIHVTKANIALAKSEPSDELVCEVIPVTLTVKNTGSTPLTGIQVVDTLPTGMSSEGKSSLTFDIASLAPGDSKDIKYIATTSTTGKFANNAKVTCAQGATAETSATTSVHQPVLSVACQSPEQQYMGRKFDVCYTIANTGDAPAAGSSLVVAVPAGLTVAASGNGQVKEGSITFDLGSIEAGGTQKACATFLSPAAATFQLSASVKGICAQVATTSCTTKVNGVPAILLEKKDDPDPVAVGDTTTYTVRVTNQGTADDSNVAVVVTIAPELVPVSSSEGTIAGQIVTLPVVAKLPSHGVLTYTIVAKGVKPGDGHTKFTLSSDMLTSPISAEESTTVY